MRRWTIPIVMMIGGFALGLTALASGQAAPSGSAARPQALGEQVGRMVDVLESARRQLPGDPLELDDVIDRVGRDPSALCKWVRTQIAFEPYRGFMKGAQGALISRRANSADKALLLAELLAKVGVKAQLAQGKPTAGAAAAVALPIEHETPDEKQLAAFSQQTGIPIERLRLMLQSAQSAREDFLERLWGRTTHDIDTLASLLAAAQVPVPASKPAPAPADHWWVRTRSGDLDPTYETPPLRQAQQTPGKPSATFDPARLPEAEFHTLALRVMIAKDGQPTPVLEASFRSADVFGQTITLANLPLDAANKLAAIGQATPEKIVEVLGAAARFQPQLLLSGSDGSNGKLISGKAFDLTGSLIDTQGGQIGAAQGLGGGLGGLLGGGGGQKPQTKLTAVWIEFEIRSPGDPAPLRIRRDVLADVPGESARQRALDLLASREMLLLPEDVSGDFVASRIGTTVRQWGKYLSTHSRKDVAKTDPKQFKGQPQFNSTLYAFAVARRGALRRLCDGRFGATAYAHERLTLVSQVSRFIDASPVRCARGIDILQNAVAPVVEANAPAAADWRTQFAFACGVLDTALEHEIVKAGDDDSNASVMLQRSLLAGAAPQVARGSLPAGATLSASARAEIQPQLADSAVVLIPGTTSAWYRVGLGDGATLGYVERAGGSEEAEYVETVEVMLQMRELLTFYGNLGRCLGAAISNPLAGVNDPHESLTQCFTAMCAMIPSMVAQCAEVEASWSNIIFTQSVNKIWDGFCEHLWESVGGEGGGEGGGGGGE